MTPEGLSKIIAGVAMGARYDERVNSTIVKAINAEADAQADKIKRLYGVLQEAAAYMQACPPPMASEESVYTSLQAHRHHVFAALVNLKD